MESFEDVIKETLDDLESDSDLDETMTILY